VCGKLGLSSRELGGVVGTRGEGVLGVEWILWSLIWPFFFFACGYGLSEFPRAMIATDFSCPAYGKGDR
jgi:hypothetical protein